MSKKILIIILLTLAVMIFLVSCQRAASQAPVPSLVTLTKGIGTSAAGQPTDLGQVAMIGTTEMLQTMTAAFAQTNSTIPGATVSTSTPNNLGGNLNPLTQVPPTGMAGTQAAQTPAVQTPVVVVPTATPGRPATYKLMQGEFPYCIARRFNVNPAELLTLNGLTGTTASQLQPGTVLNIPQSGNPFVGERSLHPHPGTFTVSSSDETIYSVACYFGDVDPTQIIAANNLVSPYVLHSNQTLNIP
jgi:LysM repeat protein